MRDERGDSREALPRCRQELTGPELGQSRQTRRRRQHSQSLATDWMWGAVKDVCWSHSRGQWFSSYSTPESPGGLVKIQIVGPTLGISDSHLEWGPRNCLPSKFPGIADAVRPRTALWEPLLRVLCGSHLWLWGSNCNGTREAGEAIIRVSTSELVETFLVLCFILFLLIFKFFFGFVTS